MCTKLPEKISAQSDKAWPPPLPRYIGGPFGSRKNAISELNFVHLWPKYNSYVTLDGFKGV